MNTIMISNWNSEHAWTYEIDPILEALFRYIDSLSLPETPYVTGRPPVSKKSLLKCFFLKTYFSIDSLRKLVRILQRFRCFQRACGLGEVPHLSTFSRAAKWFREQGFPVFHAQLLKDLEVRYPQIVLIDSTALRSSLYDSQAKWGVSTRYHWFKGYKLHLCTTAEGIILSHVLTTANRNDAAVAPELLVSLKQWDIEFVLGDAAYDSEKVRQTAEQSGILFISPINRRNSEERKDAYGRVLPVFLKTRFGQWLFGLRREIERVFNELKSDGLEQPRWYGFHRYVLHVLCCILMHNFEFLL
ncbi:IS982 family transposase (plasmid) [Geobacillus thermodenitrificans NG80-2]|uniref:IS982 family transposase n=5 Tax=Anoxybacillaceae TaxID=3120669 RepID=A4ITX6_GEOTN|nr:IS982 family transposase [Geobacillus thermodenitrificans NG80-2]